MSTQYHCIFCLSSDGPFASVEHIVPESLGNNSGRHQLPKGTICDRCNNYFSTSVERVVLGHDSFQNLRARYRIPSKRRRYPFLKGYVDNSDIEIGMRLDDSSQQLNVVALREGQKDDFERLKRNDQAFGLPSLLVFPMEVSPPQKEMSRFLAKMAFEAIFARFAEADGTAAACEMVKMDHYDNIREWARYGHNFSNWPYHYRQYFPEETLMEHPVSKEWVQFGFGYDLLVTNHPETYFIFLYLGHEFAINLGGPSIKGYERWLHENGNISVLVEKKGFYVQARAQHGGEEKHFLVPVVSPKGMMP